jgi:hypothetical protein
VDHRFRSIADEYILNNADSIGLNENEMWECIEPKRELVEEGLAQIPRQSDTVS